MRAIENNEAPDTAPVPWWSRRKPFSGSTFNRNLLGHIGKTEESKLIRAVKLSDLPTGVAGGNLSNCEAEAHA